jgi:hypothetical protein
VWDDAPLAVSEDYRLEGDDVGLAWLWGPAEFARPTGEEVPAAEKVGALARDRVRVMVGVGVTNEGAQE